jgi:homotetrameric cytidine deaminase
MSAPSVPSKPQHSRHDTALIHGLSTSEVQALSEACIEAKERAYCKLWHYHFFDKICSIPLQEEAIMKEHYFCSRLSLSPFSSQNKIFTIIEKLTKGHTLILTLIAGPYSKFRVGASLLLKSGQVIRGANVENAAYPVGTCAERTALGTAVVEGARRGDIRALAVATDISPPASPCGMCRQYIREFCEVSLEVGLTR